MKYDILLCKWVYGRHPDRLSRWVRDIAADSLYGASQIAVSQNRGWFVSMGWMQWPQPLSDDMKKVHYQTQ